MFYVIFYDSIYIYIYLSVVLFHALFPKEKTSTLTNLKCITVIYGHERKLTSSENYSNYMHVIMM